MQVATVVGARPQFIKAAPVSKAIRTLHTEVLVHTGQHYDDDMSQVFFDQLGLPVPDHNLGIGAGSHGQQTGLMLQALEEVFMAERPDVVVVFGDTNSTVAAALAASKLHIRVAHVEAGLRSFDRTMPEEINRIVTDHVSDLLFCPTDQAVELLAKEGITRGVHQVGDVMVDAFRLHAETAPDASDVLARADLDAGAYWLATIHRPVNTDDAAALGRILDAFASLDRPVLFPLHPRTKAAVARLGLAGKLAHPNLRVTAPLPYVDLMAALLGSHGLITDSGGMQKEAYLAGKRCVTARETSEWVETIEDGWNVLVGNDPAKILAATQAPAPTGPRHDHYGDGHAATRIAKLLGEAR